MCIRVGTKKQVGLESPPYGVVLQSRAPATREDPSLELVAGKRIRKSIRAYEAQCFFVQCYIGTDISISKQGFCLENDTTLTKATGVVFGPPNTAVPRLKPYYQRTKIQPAAGDSQLDTATSSLACLSRSQNDRCPCAAMLQT